MNISLLTPDEINEVISDAMSELPEEVQSAIENSNWASTLRSLVQKYKLRIDQGNLLENHVFFVMLGINKSEHLVKVIQDMGLDETQTNALIHDIDSQVFTQIKQQIMSVMTEEEKRALEAEESPTISAQADQAASPQAAAPAPSQAVSSSIAQPSHEEEALVGPPSRRSILDDVESIPQTPSSSSGNDVIVPRRSLPPVINLVDGQPKTPAAAEIAIAPQAVAETSAPVTAEKNTVPEAVQPIAEAQPDPIAAGLSKPTVTVAQSPSAPASYSSDPYREPIE